MWSKHSAAYMPFKLHSIKFKSTYKDKLVFDWKIIQDNQQVNDRYNASLYRAFSNKIGYK